ncbi:MAG: hypothetical protein A2Z14_00625 [Chloroflexi bacterium RBG_16_48_8]|nr:MAG: hypothetical protein A2Z14_00625 [Chloroflexi bacterium RBG_16_48_8]
MGRTNDEISAILFDFDGTIRHGRPRGIDIFHKLAFELGVTFTAEVKIEAERWTHKYFAMSEELKDDVLEIGGFIHDDFWLKYTRRHLEFLGAPQDYLEELALILNEKMGLANQPEDYVSEDVLPTLKALRESGYQIGLVSNRSHSITSLLEKLGLGDVFHSILTAGEIGIWKPDPELFKHAIELISTDPKKTVFVGDNYYADVLGSRAAGLIPILFDPAGIYPSPGCAVIRSIGDLQVLFRSTEPLRPGS